MELRKGVFWMSCASCLFLPLLVAGSAGAQTPSGTIVGVARDSLGAPLPGVRVTLTNRETDQARVLTSAADGSYSAASLPPSVYRVSAELAGFRRVERDATVEAGTTTSVDLTFVVGAIEEAVTVPGSLL